MEPALIRNNIDAFINGKLSAEDKAVLSDAIGHLTEEELSELFPEKIWTETIPLLMSQNKLDRSYEVMFKEIRNRKLVRTRSTGYLLKTFAAAACVAAILLAAGWLLFNKNPAPPLLAMRDIITHDGEQKKIRLPDGSVINMNGGSHLSVPEVFSKEKRTIRLIEGEAFFEVTADARRPFSINAGGAEIRVLGTSFSIRNYVGDSNLSVGVSTGKVAVLNSVEGRPVILVAGSQSTLNKKTGEQSISNVTGQPGSWQQRNFLYEHATLREIMTELRYNYGISYDIKDPANGNRKFTAGFRQRTAADIVRQLSILGNFKYSIKDRHVTIY